MRSNQTTEFHPETSRWAWIALVAVALGGGIVILFRSEFLPANFFSDGLLIKDIALGVRTAGPSYAAIGALYRGLGLADNTTIASFFGYAVMLTLLAIALRPSKVDPRREPSTFVAGAICILASAIYISYYSKDVAVALTVTLVVLIARNDWAGEVFVLLAMTLYFSVFRSEYLGVAALYVMLRLFVLRGVITVRKWILAAIIANILFSIAVVSFLGGDATAARDSVNEGRDVNTQISDFVHIPGPVGGVLNNLITSAALVVPVPLAATGPFYALVSAGVFMLWFLFFRAMRRLSLTGGRSALLTRVACLLAAMLAAQGAAEPDFGSAIRHLTPYMPLLVAVIAAPANDTPNNTKGGEVQGDNPSVLRKYSPATARPRFKRYAS